MSPQLTWILQHLAVKTAQEGVVLPDLQDAIALLTAKAQAVDEAKDHSVQQEKLININAKLEMNLRVMPESACCVAHVP